MSLHACPYCGSDKVAVEETDIGGYVVACGCCGMSGPEAPFVGIARRRWQILCSRLCNKCRRVYIKRLVELRRKLDARGESADS